MIFNPISRNYLWPIVVVMMMVLCFGSWCEHAKAQDGDFGTCQDLGVPDELIDPDMIEITEDIIPLDYGDDWNGACSCALGRLLPLTSCKCDPAPCGCEKYNIQVEIEKHQKWIDGFNSYKSKLIAERERLYAERENLLTDRDKLIHDFNPATGAIVQATEIVANVFPFTKCGKAVRLAKALKCSKTTQAKACLSIASKNWYKIAPKGEAVAKGGIAAAKTLNSFNGKSECPALVSFLGFEQLWSCLTLNDTVKKFDDGMATILARIVVINDYLRKIGDRIRAHQKQINDLMKLLRTQCCPPTVAEESGYISLD